MDDETYKKNWEMQRERGGCNIRQDIFQQQILLYLYAAPQSLLLMIDQLSLYFSKSD